MTKLAYTIICPVCIPKIAMNMILHSRWLSESKFQLQSLCPQKWFSVILRPRRLFNFLVTRTVSPRSPLCCNLNACLLLTLCSVSFHGCPVHANNPAIDLIMSAIDGLGNDAFELFKSSGFIGSFGAVWHCNQDCVSDMMTALQVVVTICRQTAAINVEWTITSHSVQSTMSCIIGRQ